MTSRIWAANDGDVETDRNMRIAKAATVFRRLDSVWTYNSSNLKINL